MQPDALSGIGLERGNVVSAVMLIAAGVLIAAALLAVTLLLQRSHVVSVVTRPFKAAFIPALVFCAIERGAYSIVAPAFLTETNDPGSVLPLGEWVALRLPEDTLTAFFDLKGFYHRRAKAKLDEPSWKQSAMHYPAELARA